MFCNQPEQYFHNRRLISITKKSTVEINREYQKELLCQTKQFNGTNVVVSGEDISLLSIDELNNLKSYFKEICCPNVRIKVIIFIRHPLTLLPSMTLQILNRGISVKESIHELTNNSMDFYRSRIEKFYKIFDASQIVTVRYEDAIKHECGLLGYFLGLLDINDDLAPQLKSKRHNSSLSLEGAVLMERINEMLPIFKDNENNPARNGLKINVLKSISGLKFSLSSDINRQVWNNSLKDINWLTNNFGLTPYKWYEPAQPDLKQIWSRETLIQVMRSTHLQPKKIRRVIVSVLISEATNGKLRIAFLKRINILVVAVLLQFESIVMQSLVLVIGSEKRVNWAYGGIKRKFFPA